MEKIELGLHPVGIEFVAQIQVVGRFHLQVGIAFFKAASRIVKAVGKQFLNLRGTLGACDSQIETVAFTDFPQTEADALIGV